MRIITSLLIFYKKLIVPSLLMALLSGFAYKYVLIAMGKIDSDAIPLFSSGAAAGAYFIFSLAFQFFIYEIKNANEYYFYYNLGLTKYVLWISNLIISLMLTLLILTL
ncbi:hypothetical protein [Polaribacter butkevichii]